MLVVALSGSCNGSTLAFGDRPRERPTGQPSQPSPSSQAGPAARPNKPSHAKKYEQPAVPLGLNLGAVNYYATAVPFVDGWKMSDPFQSTNAGFSEGRSWNTEVADKIPRDPQGYPLELPAKVDGVAMPQILRASVMAPVYSGRYTLLYDGDGEIDFPASPVTIVSQTRGRIELDVQARSGSTIFLAIKRSTRGSHVRNIRLILPGFTQTYTQQVFHPTFLARLKGVSTLRFMDWGTTNGSELERWQDRPLPEGSQAVRGVSLETMIDLANRVGTDAWFCVPHKADDGYVEQMAKLIKARLDPKHRIYIEYSNELWNAIFPQVAWTANKGCAAKLNQIGAYPGSCDQAGPRYWAGIKWQARRSGQIFKIFDRVFAGEGGRVVRVLAGQAANQHLNEKLLESFEDPKINLARSHADVLAVAPYIGGEIASTLVEQGKKDSVNELQILDLLEKDIGSSVVASTRANKKIADRFGVGLVAYEGGQHLVAHGEASHDERFVQKLIATQRLPRMGAIYQAMLDAWYKNSGDGLMVLFNYAEASTKFGSWGLLESQEQRPEAAPKYQAFMDRLQKLNFSAAERALKAGRGTTSQAAPRAPPAPATSPAPVAPAAPVPNPPPSQ
jgi:hypothetical protein